MKRGRLRWILFGACAALVVGAMAWTTSSALSLEASQRAAEREAALQKDVRIALWRIDSALAPLLAQEAALPWQRRPTAGGAPGRWWVNEVALDRRFADDRVRLRFLIHDIPPPKGLPPNVAEALVAAARRMDQVAERTPHDACDDAALAALSATGAARLRARVRRDARAISDWIAATNVAPAQVAEQQTEGVQQADVNSNDRQQRARAVQNTYQTLAGQNGTVQQEAAVVQTAAAPDVARPYVPVWLESGGRRFLAYVREPYDSAVQGFILDWARTQASLAAEVADLFPGASVVPVEETSVANDGTGMVLTTAPATLAFTRPADDGPGWTPTRTGLAIAWLAVLGALGAAAATLRATVADADRRARFASSVTHELRTPLTTFRLYSEMLADGMVKDEATRAEYLRTLKGESARLATLVENVLSFARVEEGRAPRQRERIAVGDLVERATSHLRRRADEAGMSLLVRVDTPDAVVVANADAVGQVLANLVDNACKYAASADDRTIDVTVSRTRDAVEFRVRDHGPGLAPENVAAAFAPFERGNRPPGDTVPGIGLGLALSRGLARDHGGDLVHETPEDGRGALFVLSLPAA